MRPFNAILSFLIVLLVPFANASEASKNVGILISSYGEKGRENLSYDLEELAQAYLVLNDNEASIDLISPKGGAVLVKNNKDQLPFIQRFKNETPALKQLANTLSSKEAIDKTYDAVLVIGGSGAMFDLPVDQATQAFLEKHVNSSKPIAAVCHGPAALVNVKRKDGSYFVANKKVNGFTNAEERAFGSNVIDDLPFLLEDKLKEHGATFVNNAPMLPYISVDGNLITAQNPGAVAQAAEVLLTKAGVDIKDRKPFKDEATLALISKARSSGSYLIDLAIKSKPEMYDMNYMALYGFYAYGLAGDKASKLVELDIMQAIGRNFEHPVYLAKLISAEIEQGMKAKAKQNFEKFKDLYPDHEKMADLKGLINGKAK